MGRQTLHHEECRQVNEVIPSQLSKDGVNEASRIGNEIDFDGDEWTDLEISIMLIEALTIG